MCKIQYGICRFYRLVLDLIHSTLELKMIGRIQQWLLLRYETRHLVDIYAIA